MMQLKRRLPIGLARCRVQTTDRFRVPDDQLPGLADGVDRRRAIADRKRRQRPPNLLARVLVHRDDHAAIGAAERDDSVAVEQRTGGIAQSGTPRLGFIGSPYRSSRLTDQTTLPLSASRQSRSPIAPRA